MVKTFPNAHTELKVLFNAVIAPHSGGKALLHKHNRNRTVQQVSVAEI